MSSKSKMAATIKEGKPALVPKLRFPEFRGTDGWPEKPLGNVLAPVIRERAKPKESYVGLGLRSHGKGTFLKPQEDPTKNSMDQLFEVKPNDLIVNITFAWEGAVAIAKACDDGALVSHRFPTYTFEKGEASPEFFQYVIAQKTFVYDLGVISPGGAGRNRVLNKNDFQKITVRLPSPREQKRIADCLSSADEVIAAQTRKVEALKAHKEGLMQQLFPRPERIENGVTVPAEIQPRFRFPEFSRTGKWSEKPLEKIAEINPKSEELPESFVYIDLGSVDAGVLKTRTSISRRGAPSRAQRVIKNGDIIYQIVRPYLRNNLLCEFEGIDDYVASTGYAQLRAKGSNRFLYQSIHADPFVSRVIAKCTGSNYPAINSSDLAKIQLPVPPTLSEQERIADCLSGLDALIKAETQKLNALGQHKRGLMQQLFPASEGVET
jgi:type I restriction enzyme S subunit